MNCLLLNNKKKPIQIVIISKSDSMTINGMVYISRDKT